MTAFALAHLRHVTMGPAIVEYLRRIDATLVPFHGRVIVHGGRPEVLKGEWAGHLILIEFPDLDSARAWYRSDAYRAMLCDEPIRRSPVGHAGARDCRAPLPSSRPARP